MKKVRIWPVLLAAAIGFCILCGLGVWQVKRLAWKEALIASIEAGAKREPASLGRVLDNYDARQDVSYARVNETGHFLPGHDILILTTNKGGAAWGVARAFVVKDSPYGENAWVVLVECGKSLDQAPPLPPVGEVTLEGIVRFHPGYKGFFDPANNPDSKQWYWWDIPEMLKSVPGHEVKLGLFTVLLLPNSPGTEGLIVEPPKVDLRNNHLGYAITWFGLAAALVGVTGVYVFRPRRS